MQITPKPNPGRPGWRVTFRHPVTKRIVTGGLSTRDESAAVTVCRHLSSLSDRPELWQEPENPVLLGFALRAVELWFGSDSAHAAFVRKNTDPNRPLVKPDEAAALRSVEDNRKLLAEVAAATGATVNAPSLDDVLQRIPSTFFAEYVALQNRCREQAARLADIEPELESYRVELDRIRRKANEHVKVSMGAAWDAFTQDDDYKALHPKTQADLDRVAASFIGSLRGGRHFRLAEVRAAHVGTWLSALRSAKRTKDGKATGAALSAVTKAKQKRYLSVWMTFAFKKFDLSENPMDKTGKVKGAAVGREDIAAFRVADLRAFREMLDTLATQDHYWHALVATATLAGPRYSELAWMKIEHVNLQANEIVIATRRDGETVTGTKTGRERRLPIESTVLRAALEAHIKRRLAEQKRKGATAAERSPFLFPSTVGDHPGKPRTLTPAGIWCESSTFLRAWRGVAARCEEVTGARDYWRFGPREWRHCAGTAMGYSGNDSLRISAWLGNSEDVCRKHYIRTSEKGERWPFEWR
ncbi:MAG: hypothetical protein AMXMBFR7_26650 [Planctomycetota bacterium]